MSTDQEIRDELSARTQRRIGAAQDPHAEFEARKKETKEMYEKFKKINDAKNTVEYLEFLRFAPLYQQQTSIPEQGTVEWNELHDLSMDFYRRFSMYDPIVITLKGEHLVTLPPVYHRPDSLEGVFDVRSDGQKIYMDDAVAMFHNRVNPDTPPAYQEAATSLLITAIHRSQRPEHIRNSRALFDELARKVDEVVRRSVEGDGIVVETSPEEGPTTPAGAATGGFNFNLDE